MAEGQESRSDIKTGPMRKFVQKIDKKFNFQVHPHHFFTFVSQKTLQVNVYYFAYRWVVFLLCFLSSFITITDLGNPIKDYERDATFYLSYFIYFSNTSLTLYTVSTSFGAYFITKTAHKYKFGRPVPVTNNVNRFRKVYWKLHQIKNMVALSITTTFWVLVYPVSNYTLDMNNFVSHGVNAVITLVDFAVTGLPYNLSVVWIAWVYATCYIAFTYVYWICDGYARPTPLEEHPHTKVLYNSCTDWDKVGQTIICYFGFICSLAWWHVITCALNRIRIRWWKERPEDMIRNEEPTEDRKRKKKENS